MHRFFGNGEDGRIRLRVENIVLPQADRSSRHGALESAGLAGGELGWV